MGRGGAGWLGGWLGVHFGWGHVGVPGARARPGEHPPNYRLHLLTPRCLPASPPPCCPPRLWPRPTPRPSTPAPPRSEGAQGQQAVRPPGCKPQGRSGSSSGGGGYIRARRRPPPGRAGAPSSPPPRVFSSRLARLRRAGLVDVTMVMVSGDPGGGPRPALRQQIGPTLTGLSYRSSPPFQPAASLACAGRGCLGSDRGPSRQGYTSSVGTQCE